ncbi:hypothetical protein [uncultured Rhodoblastus sp.]|uniref:hypothetical protein n=1 Tax=uncultured Rhodoblastus sp. TaxID=543037 RepID=UPI0025D5EF86|nr:hypothetical protein [uncultured Rhodoblastus sp.]
MGPDWKLAPTAAECSVLGLLLSAPFEPSPEKAAARSAGEAIVSMLHPGNQAAQTIVEQHCAACHAAAPLHPDLFRAAAGLDFSTAAQLTKHRAEILRVAVFFQRHAAAWRGAAS